MNSLILSLKPKIYVLVFNIQDPYVKLQLRDMGGRIVGRTEKTRVVDNAGSNATFNETFTLPYSPGADILEVELWDKDTMRDDFLGKADVPFLQMCPPGQKVKSEFLKFF